MVYTKVVCAILTVENKVLLFQRSELMTNPLLWEFPGGKIKLGESTDDAIVRECFEELNIVVKPTKTGKSIFHSYTHIAIELIPVHCAIIKGKIQLTEHQRYISILPQHVLTLNLSCADKKLVKTNNYFSEWLM